MTVGVDPTLVLVVAVVLLAAAVNGVAGFGFALVGTAALATVAAGRRLRARVPGRWRRRLVLSLLVVVGVRLVASGA